MGKAGRPPKEKKAMPTRLWPETVRILRTLSAWTGESMADFTHRLAVEAAHRTEGQVVIQGLQDLKADPPPDRKVKKSGS